MNALLDFRRSRWVCLLVACFFPIGAFLSGSEPSGGDYLARLAAARQFAAEKSWSLARETYKQALPLAPSDGERRWVELWEDDAALRALEPGRWEEREPAWKEHRALFDKLLAPYAREPKKDAFWFAAMESEANWTAYSRHGDAWEIRREVADALALQPPTIENADAYVDFLQRSLSRSAAEPWAQIRDQAFWREHLAAAARATKDGTRRAWCLLTFAELTIGDDTVAISERLAALDAAISAAHGTAWDALARTTAFVWKSQRGLDVEAPPGSRPDFRERVHIADTLRNDLETAPDSPGKDRLLREVTRLRDHWQKPTLKVLAPQQAFSGTVFSFGVGASGIGRLRMQLFQLSPQEFAANAQRQDRPRTRPPGKPVWTLEKLFPHPEDLSWQSDVVGPPDRLKSGLYTLVVEAMDQDKVAPFISDLVVSDVRVTSVGSPSGRATLLFQTARESRPLAGADVKAVFFGDEESRAFAGKTDAAGTVSLESARPKGGALRVAGAVGDQSFSARVEMPPKERDEFMVDLFLDRALYRPGETVHWKMIVRQRISGALRVPEQKAGFRWSLELGDETLSPEAALVLNEYGTAHGEVVIPATARPGEAVLRLRRDADGEGEWNHREDAFRVDSFRAPAMQLSLEPASPPQSLRPGQEVRFRARLGYFSGGPAAGVPIRCELLATANHLLASADGQRTDESLKRLKKNLESVTNTAGVAEFRVALPPDLPSRLTLLVSATALPDGGEPVHALQSMTITDSGLLVDAGDETTKAQIRAAGSDAVFSVRIVNGMMEPSPFRGLVELVEERWVGLWLDANGTIVPSEPPLGSDATALHEGWATVRIACQEAQAGADGLLNTAFRLPHAGIFRLRVLGPDGETPLELTTSAFVWRYNFDGRLAVVAVGERDARLSFPPQAAYLFGPERENGDKPRRLLCVLPEKAPFGVVTLWNGDEESIQWVDARGSRICWLTLPKGISGGSWRADLSIPGSSFGSLRTAFWSEPEPSRELKLQIDPVERESKPGEAVDVRLQLSDAKGRPRPGEIAVAVTDESVNRLTDRTVDKPRFTAETEPSGRLWVTFPPVPQPFVPASPPDQRPGAVIRSARPDALGGDQVVLSPFEINSPGVSMGYASGAGGRMKAKAADAALGQGNGLGSIVTVRRHFSSTAFWAPDVVADREGAAVVHFTYPDNLTEWRVEAYAVGADGSSFGRDAVFTKTSLPFQARLQTPRFLVTGDRAEISALVVNRTDDKLVAKLGMRTSGPVSPLADTQSSVDVRPQGEARHGWSLQASGLGDAEFTLEGRSRAGDDGMHVSIPVVEDGLVQHTAFSGRLGPGETERAFDLALPEPMDPGRTQAVVQLSSSRAAVVLDALPFLIDYPYGCVEQTMSRFFPAVAVQQALQRFGISPKDLDERLLRETEARGDGPVPAWKKLDDVVQYGIRRLVQAQRGDGGFGWWPDAPDRDLWMTSYVAWGLEVASDGGANPPDELLESTRQAVIDALKVTKIAPDEAAFALAALARGHVSVAEVDAVRPVFESLYRDREKLGASGRACLALASIVWGTTDQRRVLRDNLENGADRKKSDDAGDTVHWGATEGYWLSRDNAAECTALSLLALLKLDPKDPLIEPAANWLVLNRRSSRWKSTRDTAFAVLALTELMAARSEIDAEAEIDVELDGYSVGRVRLNRASLLQGAQQVSLPGTQLKPGTVRINLRRTGGDAPVYAVGLSSAWVQGDAVKPEGHLVSIHRSFVRQAPQPTLSGSVLVAPVELSSGGACKTGEELDARVHISVSNDLEYVMVEVPRPAGCEPLNPLSGWDARLLRDQGDSPAERMDGRDAGTAVYREEHDTKSVFFIRSLPAGKWTLRFGLRSVTPGDYRALPAQVSAMYVPEVTANSDAQRVKLEAK
ncbi:hypothetical protein DB347_05620 [Opitutaceae bacterium EW11]|nr:hypothetical protein DB347_05620 [Opitutaceae bacterium EW11]